MGHAELLPIQDRWHFKIVSKTIWVATAKSKMQNFTRGACLQLPPPAKNKKGKKARAVTGRHLWPGYAIAPIPPFLLAQNLSFLCKMQHWWQVKYGYINSDGFDGMLRDYTPLQNHLTPLSQCRVDRSHLIIDQQPCECAPFSPDCAKCTATPVTTATSTSTTITVKGRTTNKQHLKIENHYALDR